MRMRTPNGFTRIYIDFDPVVSVPNESLQGRFVRHIADHFDNIEIVTDITMVPTEVMVLGEPEYMRHIETNLYRTIEDRVRPKFIFMSELSWYYSSIQLHLSATSRLDGLMRIRDPLAFVRANPHHHGLMYVQLTAVVFPQLRINSQELQPGHYYRFGTRTDDQPDDIPWTDGMSPDTREQYPLDALLDDIRELTGD